MAGTVADLLTEAYKWADMPYREGANNATPFGAWYGMNNVAWCDQFVSYCANVTDNADVIGKFAYCPAHVNFFAARGQWLGPDADAKAGDVVFFKWPGSHLQGADHVGIVRADSLSGQSVKTVEGNAGANDDGVYRLERPRSVILGFGRPAYAAVGVVPGGGSWFKTKLPMTVAALAAALGVSVTSFTAANDPAWKPGDVLSANTPVVVASAPAVIPDAVTATSAPSRIPVASGPSVLPTSYPFPGAGAFRFGVENTDTLALNTTLIARGYGKYYPSPTPTDVYSAYTIAALAAFQTAQGWDADSNGYPGPVTWQVLAPKKIGVAK